LLSLNRFTGHATLQQNTLYLGGSVGRRRADGLDVINLLHGCETVPGETVVEGVKLGGLQEALLHVADGRAQPDQFKVCIFTVSTMRMLQCIMHAFKLGFDSERS
jgi:hypothetical protein